MTLKTTLVVRQGYRKCHHAIERAYDFLLTFYSNYGSIFFHFWNTEWKWYGL